MIVFRPNGHAYMPGVDIVNRPVVAAAAAESWADYANTVFDDLLALEFRGAASLAAATLYGSTPSIVAEPGGGLNLTANGLVCAGDTALDSGLSPATAPSVYALMYDWSGTTFYSHVWGFAPGGNGFGSGWWTGDEFRIFISESAVDYRSATTTSLPYTYGIIDYRIYQEGSFLNDTGLSSMTYSTSMYIAARREAGSTAGRLLTGTIACLLMGDLKAGADADTVAAQLHTRMQTAA